MNKNLLLKIKNNRMPSGLLYTLYGVGIAVVIIAFLVITKIFQFGTMMAAGASFVMPPEPVNMAIVRQEQWQQHVGSVGTVTAVQGTTLSVEADGIIRTIKFIPGATVKAGEELVRLDTDIEQTQLRSAEAAAEGARLTYNRAKELIGTGAISKSEFNNVDVALKQADAQVENIRAIIDRKILRAPFSGKLGIRSISVGQFLNKGTPVVQLYSLSPVYVEFSLPQQRIGELSEGLTVTVSSDAYPEKKFEGKITAINPSIDLSTRNVRVQATLLNPESQLRPGMYVSVDMVLAKSDMVLFIPITAVSHSATGDSVFVIEDSKGADNKPLTVIQQQLVTLGERQGDFVVVNKGLTAGQRIVSTGVFKLRPDMQVVIDNTLAPDFKLAPKPDNT